MKLALLLLVSLATSAFAYEALQGPTELLYWDKTNTYNGYTWFGVRGTTYLLDMEGRVAHTWPVGTNPHLLTNGNVLDASKDDPSGFGGLTEVNWNGSNVWSYTETRTNYAPHHDYTRIFNPKLNAFTTLYIANKTVSSNQCIAAGCDPFYARNYTNAQMDAIVEVDMAGNIVWEWWFFDHVIQSFDATKSNYVGAGKTVADYPGRLNVNIPGLPVQRDWHQSRQKRQRSCWQTTVLSSLAGLNPGSAPGPALKRWAIFGRPAGLETARQETELRPRRSRRAFFACLRRMAAASFVGASGRFWKPDNQRQQ